MLRSNRSFWKNPVTVVLSALLLFFISQLIGTFVALSFSDLVPSQNYKMMLYVSANVLVLFGLINIAMKVVGFTWEQIGWKKTYFKNVLKVLPAFLVYIVISTGLTILATKLISGFDVEQTQDIGFKNIATNAELLATFISLVILTPIFEEIIFRGVLFKGLRRRVPYWGAAVITSFAFAVAHMQWNVAVDTFALSLILCYLVEKSNSIVPAIFLHALKNSLAFVLLFIIK